MRKKEEVFIQCGYEDICENKNCLKCPKKRKYNLNLTLAEEIAIEDFAVCDLKWFRKERPKELELTQRVIMSLMYKIFKQQK